MYLSSEESYGLYSAFARQRRVLSAVMLRNIRTRFFGHGLGYLIAIAWPLVHMLVIIAMFSFGGRAPPFGESTILFIATGSVQFMTFSYLSRFMMLSIIMTRPLLSFPQVKVLDVLFASALLEILSACFVTIIMIILAWFFDIPAMPQDIVQASYAFGSAILLGLGFGVLNGVIALAVPIWATGYALITILLWATSGVVFVPDAFPEPLRTCASYHPILQTIEWMRSAYYEGYGEGLLDRAYAIEVGVGSLFLGLVLERGMRGHLLALR
jgi:capsular polysaccharide transport system permease protein